MIVLLALSVLSLHAGVILSDNFTCPDGVATIAPGSPRIAHSTSAENEEVRVFSGKFQLASARW